jgi:hypothetical protein
VSIFCLIAFLLQTQSFGNVVLLFNKTANNEMNINSGLKLILLMLTFSIWQVGQKKAINFQVCTEPKRCILFLIYSFLKAKSTIWRCLLIALNLRKAPNALFAIYRVVCRIFLMF